MLIWCNSIYLTLNNFQCRANYMGDVRNYIESVLTLWHTLVLTRFWVAFFIAVVVVLGAERLVLIFKPNFWQPYFLFVFFFFFFIKIECRIGRENILAICICCLFEFQDKQKITVFLNPSFTKCQELELYCEAICNFLPLGSFGLWTILLLILFITLSQVK